MSHDRRCLLIFQSIHHVLAAEAALQQAGLPADLVPVPKEISPDCGMAITLAPADRARARAALTPNEPRRIIDHWQP